MNIDAELTDPHATTTISAEYSSAEPLRVTMTLFTTRPDGSVSNRSTQAPVRSSTLECSRAGSTQIT